MWADGYSWEVEYDQITIFLDIGEEHVMESHIIFYDEHATLRGHKQGIPTLRFEYANPAFDDLLIDTLKKRLHI